MWLLSAGYCGCFGLHISFYFSEETDVEVADVGFVGCQKIRVGEMTSLPFCSTYFVCYVVCV